MRVNGTFDQVRGTRALTGMAMIAILSISGACGGSDTTAPPETEFGVYTLTTVNGQPLPFTMNNTALGTVVIQNATLDLVSQASAPAYTAVVNGTVNGQATQRILADVGTYARTGATLTFSSTVAAGLTYPGTLNGNALTVSIPGAAIGSSGTIVLGMQR